MKFWRLHRPGYRVLKTVIAATLTLLVCSRFSEMSPVLALMGAYCAMGRTICESWTGCLNQMVGVLVGSVLGFLLLHVLLDPPALVIGLSLFFVIGLCNLLHMSYAVFLSSVIFISVCSGASQLPDILARVRDVSIGLAFGLAVNIFVHPYANERQVLALLKTRRNRRSLAWQTGCVQLAGRMVQEVTALGMMDSFGRVSEENKKRLDTLDSAQEISLPEISLQVPAADSVQDTVMNYHIACYCQAYAYLTLLLPLWKDEEPEQAAKQGEETSNEKARQGSCAAE
ncbi:MAG TPA: hypothetical protein DEQ85_08045 [Clostridiales bacterium]|nr:hypothetical protein [Clostridiales bacterium]